MKILRTTGTLICGKVITKNEHGVFIKVLFLRKELSRGGASSGRWESSAENVSDYDSCKVFCKKQDMANNFEGDSIKQNTVVVAIVKNFDRIAANRVNVSMLNEDYAEKDLEEILCIPNSDSNFKFREPLGSNAKYFGSVDAVAEDTLSKNTAKSDNDQISSTIHA